MLKILKGNMPVLTGKKQIGLYVLEVHCVCATMSLSVSNSDKDVISWKWHMKLGHVGKKGRKIISSSAMFGEDTVTKLPYVSHVP